MESPEKASQAPVTPRLAVDLIIDMGAGVIVLVERKYEPFGWALPGGFVEVGETVEEAAIREAKEETGLDVELVRQFHTYSHPDRDPRGHTVGVVFVARAWGKARAGSDAKSVDTFYDMNMPETLCFDHRDILKDYYHGRY